MEPQRKKLDCNATSWDDLPDHVQALWPGGLGKTIAVITGAEFKNCRYVAHETPTPESLENLLASFRFLIGEDVRFEFFIRKIDVTPVKLILEIVCRNESEKINPA